MTTLGTPHNDKKDQQNSLSKAQDTQGIKMVCICVVLVVIFSYSHSKNIKELRKRRHGRRHMHYHPNTIKVFMTSNFRCMFFPIF